MTFFADISDYKDLTDLLPIVTAVIVVEWTFIFFCRWFLKEKNINAWYTKFGMTAFLSDVTILIIGLLLARYFYKTFFTQWNITSYTLLSVGIQVIHDVIYYLGFILPTPLGQNAIMDTMKTYAADVGGMAILGDSYLISASALLASYLKSLPQHVIWFVLVVSAYMLPYAIYERPA